MIGARLRQLRQRNKYSLRDLAKMTGLSHSFICDIEHGRSAPSLETLRKIATALNVKEEIFFTNVVANNDLPTGTEGN